MIATTATLAVNNFGDTREDSSLAGPLALLMVVLIGIATVLLIRNMNKRLRRLPSEFDNQADASGSGGNDASTGPGEAR